MTLWIVMAVVAFLCGSIPFGLLIGKARGIDVREHGSKNIGATNVRRVLGSRAGNLCLALDILKGLIPTAAAGTLTGAMTASDLAASETWWWLGVMAASVLGHMFSPWVGFKGGKGIATGLGALVGVFPYLTGAAAIALVIWLVSTRVTRYVGVSSCLAAISLPGGYWLTSLALGRGESSLPFLVVTSALALLVVYKHRGNLSRTLAGTEHRIGERVSTSGKGRQDDAGEGTA